MSSPVRRLLKFLATLPVLAYLSLVGLMYWKQDELLFPRPARSGAELAAAAAELGAEEVRVVAEDGVALYGWRLRAGGERAVLYFGGNGSSVGDNPLLYRRLTSAGLDVLHVNYRGYPGSEGVPSEEGLRKDARAAWGALRKEFPAEAISLLGRSLGGGVAVGLAAEHTPRSLVTLASFTRAVDVAAETYPWLPVRRLMRSPFDSVALAASVRCPTLILHGTADRIIPPHHAEGLAGAFPETPEVIWLEGRGHNDDLLGDPAALEAVLELVR